MASPSQVFGLRRVPPSSKVFAPRWPLVHAFQQRIAPLGQAQDPIAWAQTPPPTERCCLLNDVASSTKLPPQAKAERCHQ